MPISVMPAAAKTRRGDGGSISAGALVRSDSASFGPIPFVLFFLEFRPNTLDSPGLLPEHASPVNRLDSLVDTLARPVILNSITTGRDTSIIVDQTVATGG